MGERAKQHRPRVGEYRVELPLEIRAGKDRPVQMVREQAGRVTAAMRQAFLNALAATCNVAQSARVAEISNRTVYELRRREPMFAQRWEEALEIGYQRLETQLLGRALEAIDDDWAIDPDAAPVPPLPPLAEAAATAPAEATASGRGYRIIGAAGAANAARGLPMPYQLALAVLGRRDAVREKGPRTGPGRRMDAGEVDKLLARKLDALAARNARKRAAAAAAVPGEGTDDGEDA